mmetsp:Transcript_9109/g.33628  ORF Transcript_9109/g.33628 Transcript_9109/m.33628 type:complete len:140 (-) Transcript_9109:2629-3048(-)
MLPLVKLGILGIKIISKQVVKNAKVAMTRSPRFHAWAVRFGRFYHRYEFQWKTGRRNRSLEDVDDAKAVQSAAEIIGEGILFVILAVLVTWEYHIKPKREEAAETAALNLRFQELREDMDVIKEELKALRESKIPVESV